VTAVCGPQTAVLELQAFRSSLDDRNTVREEPIEYSDGAPF
jgi:hypothetical protein